MPGLDQQIPKYLQISQAIIARIRGGELEAGDKVPSENDIIRMYGVSNTTARKALAEIEQAGWVTRVKARGTFVCARNVGRSVDRILGFTRNMIEAGRQPTTRVLSVGVEMEGKTLAVNGRPLHLPGPVCRLERLRFADGVPLMKEVRYVSMRLCPGINERDLERSLYEIYEQDYQLELASVDQIVSSVILDEPHLMSLFEVAAPVPAFAVQGVTYCGKEVILEMENSLYRGDIYSFTVKASR